MGNKEERCPGCGRHCALSKPHCRIGVVYARTGQLPGKKGAAMQPHREAPQMGPEDAGMFESLRSAARAVRRGVKRKGPAEKMLRILKKRGETAQGKLLYKAHLSVQEGQNALDVLEGQGLIQRAPRKDNPQKARIALTRAGEERAAKKGRTSPLSNLSAEEKAQLGALLQKIGAK